MCGILSSAKVVYQMNPMERNLSAAPLEGVLYRAAQAKPAKVREKDRDPYDGLRPWSAITHGLGAVLALVGTVNMIVLRLLIFLLNSNHSDALKLLCLVLKFQFYLCKEYQRSQSFELNSFV